jgi:L-threonylcarbamoyladenylate synthase
MAQIWLPEDIKKAIETIAGGGLILFPTDTIWGIGCDATDPNAVARIHALKRRPEDKPLVVLVESIDMLQRYVESIHPRVETLLTLHERPLTIIYPKARDLAENLISKDGSIAIRVTSDPYCRELINSFGKPVVATSANVSGEPPPPHFGGISSEIIRGVDYVCKYRQHDTREGEPSVIATYDHRGHLDFIRS